MTLWTSRYFSKLVQAAKTFEARGPRLWQQVPHDQRHTTLPNVGTNSIEERLASGAPGLAESGRTLLAVLPPPRTR